MNVTRPTFVEYLRAKGVLRPDRLHPRLFRALEQSYAHELFGLQAPATIRVANTPPADEIHLQAEGAVADEVNLRAASEPAELQIAAANADGTPKIPSFDMVAYCGGPIRPTGWYQEDPLILDIEGMTIRASVPIDVNHATDIGHSTTIEKTTGKLKAKGVLSSFDPEADDQEAVLCRAVVRRSKNGFPFGASVDANAVRSKIEFCPAGQTVKANGKTWPGPVYVARKSTLNKIAILSQTEAADRNTTTSIAAQRSDSMDPQFVAWLKAQGLPETPVADQLIGLKAAWEASKKTPLATPVDADAQIRASRAAQAAEDRRVAGIRAAFAKHPKLTAVPHPTEPIKNGSPFTMDVAEFQAHAIETGMSVDAVALVASEAMLAQHRNERPKGGHGQTDTLHAECTSDVLSAGLMLRCGVKLDNPHFATPKGAAIWGFAKNGQSKIPGWLRAGINDPNRNRVMDLAHQFSSLSAVDLCARALQLAGRDVPHEREEMIRASFSSGTLTSIFTDSVNAKLVATYLEAPDTTQGWTQETEVNDFKVNSDIRLTKGQPLSLHPRGGEADHHARSDAKETYQIARYSGQFSVDEQDVIDDMLGAINDVPVEMGNAAARLRPDLVYAILLANPTLLTTARQLFNGTDDNVDTGSALSEATLKIGIANMNVKQENGVNLNLNPTHLIVPSTLRFLGKELIRSGENVIAGVTDRTRGNVNVLSDENLTLVSDSRLENGVTDPSTSPPTARLGSASQWYLACAIARTILVAYLRGSGRVPQVRTFMLDKGKWGMGWDVKMDIGSKARDFRGLYRATA